MRRRRPPFSLATRRPALLGRSLFAGGQRNAKQKLGFLKNRGVPPPLIEKLAPYAQRARGRDLEWFARQLSEELRAAGPALNAMIAKEAEMLGDFDGVLDWLIVRRPNYTGMSWEQAKQRSDAWHAALADKRPRKKRMRSRDVVMELEDKWVWVKIPKEEYRDEGSLMGHCFGNRFKDRAAWSLRDPWNRPHVTVSALPPGSQTGLPEDPTRRRWKFMEAKGKGNAIPIPAYSQMTLDFLATLPFGPSFEIHGTDIERMIDQVVGKRPVSRAKLYDQIAPMRSLDDRARVSLEVAPPEAVRSSITARSPAMIPDFYGRESVQFLLRKLEKERSPARIVQWARTLAQRLDWYAEQFDNRLDPVGGEALWRELQRELGGSVKISKDLFATLARKAASKNTRDRLVAAALLPPNSLGRFANDPSANVWTLAAVRAGSRVATAFLKSSGRVEGQAPGGPSPLLDQGWMGRPPEMNPPGTRMFIPGLVWKIPKRAFVKMWKGLSWEDWPANFGTYTKAVLERAGELKLDVSRKLKPAGIKDADDLQWVARIVPFEETGPWVAAFFREWDTGEAWGGDIHQVFQEEVLGKFAAADPEDCLGWIGDIAILDLAVGWLWGRPGAARNMREEFKVAHGFLEHLWEVAEAEDLFQGAGQTDYGGHCRIYESFYLLARISGDTHAKAERFVWSLGPNLPEAAEKQCSSWWRKLYARRLAIFKKGGSRPRELIWDE